jgi:virulence-associated protein VagC
MVADVIKTKTFRNGGSLAVRIPAGWVTEGEITLSRDEATGQISLQQSSTELAKFLAAMANGNPIESTEFDEAISRPIQTDTRSIFER